MYERLRCEIQETKLSSFSVILALFSTVGITIFAKTLKNVSTKVTDGLNNNDTSPTEEALAPETLQDRSWYNDTCAADPEGTACRLCEPCVSSSACDRCVAKEIACEKCHCDPKSKGPLCKWFGMSSTDGDESSDNSTDSESEKKNPLAPLKKFLGEPAEDSPCRNITGRAKGVVEFKRTFCQLYEVTNSWHCDKEETFMGKIECIMGVVEASANKKFVVAGLLIVSLICHIINIVIAIWCANGPQSSGDYEGIKEDKDADAAEKEKDQAEEE